ncbi:hypothetical protein PGTUg99_002145 [Puccinia graminis f. sp. tritici]|uniref:Uncharacterized protein n=1 Tax=Puccinia graminis f. sp. tritici TaxID=56615 RepID=A0A5B0PC86_PUCGR|nr:hypothetical protein PGTUg99_002145 [Puccinia graminis f. sp. tritici]
MGPAGQGAYTGGERASMGSFTPPDNDGQEGDPSGHQAVHSRRPESPAIDLSTPNGRKGSSPSHRDHTVSAAGRYSFLAIQTGKVDDRPGGLPTIKTGFLEDLKRFYQAIELSSLQGRRYP